MKIKSDVKIEKCRSFLFLKNEKNLSPSVKHGGGIMVWSCFTAKGLGPLVKVEVKMKHQDYINILENKLLSFIQENFRTNHYKFQDDNAPVHTAKNVKKWMSEKNLKVLEVWPSQSPDLNTCGMSLIATP